VILVHVAVPEADDLPAFFRKKAGSLLVALGIDMLAAVDLHDKLGLPAGQIGGKWVD
jgi:hypothetical protein